MHENLKFPCIYKYICNYYFKFMYIYKCICTTKWHRLTYINVYALKNKKARNIQSFMLDNLKFPYIYKYILFIRYCNVLIYAYLYA